MKKRKEKFNIYQYYEKIKLRNFKNSSRLEGLEVDIENNLSLVEVIKKHKK